MEKIYRRLWKTTEIFVTNKNIFYLHLIQHLLSLFILKKYIYIYTYLCGKTMVIKNGQWNE